MIWKNTLCAQILTLIEDNERANQVIKALKQAGHKVVACANYTDAIELLQSSHFALIISDVHLENGGNVFDFLRWVRRNPLTSETPFVLYGCKPTPTAKYLEEGLRCSARLLGATKYIVMDNFDTNEFRRQIDPVCPPVHKHSPGQHSKKTLRDLVNHRTLRYAHN
jgi:CheY-like chemotaxis protein